LLSFLISLFINKFSIFLLLLLHFKLTLTLNPNVIKWKVTFFKLFAIHPFLTSFFPSTEVLNDFNVKIKLFFFAVSIISNENKFKILIKRFDDPIINPILNLLK